MMIPVVHPVVQKECSPFVRAVYMLVMLFHSPLVLHTCSWHPKYVLMKRLVVVEDMKSPQLLEVKEAVAARGLVYQPVKEVSVKDLKKISKEDLKKIYHPSMYAILWCY